LNTSANPDEAYNKSDVRVTPIDDYFLKYYYDPHKIAENCTRWGQCRWVSFRHIKNKRFSKICPSVAYYYFDAYSLQGRLFLSLALMDERLKYEDSAELLDIFYKCNLCGGCDAMCKLWENEGEPLRVLEDMRANLVSDGLLLPTHLIAIDSLKKEDNMMMERKSERGRWAEGLDVKKLTEENATVCYHAGCRLSFEKDQWEVARETVKLLKDIGVDVGIMEKDEACCGGRAFEMGYRSEYIKYAENNIEAWRNAGVKTVVTSCSDCYHTFKRRYSELGSEFEIIHISEFIDRQIKKGKIQFSKNVPMKVTYHDPCHLGRRSDVYIPGKPIEGVYDSPRDVIKNIPGIQLVEMDRIREYAWCCGSGCWVREDYPDFNAWTANERIEEALATGAEALVTACPWCEKNFMEAVSARSDQLRVLDIIELVRAAM